MCVKCDVWEQQAKADPAGRLRRCRVQIRNAGSPWPVGTSVAGNDLGAR